MSTTSARPRSRIYRVSYRNQAGERVSKLYLQRPAALARARRLLDYGLADVEVHESTELVDWQPAALGSRS